MPGNPSTTLVVVPCHGVVIDPSRAAEQSAWIGIFPAEAPLLAAHIRQGVELAHGLNAWFGPAGGVTRDGTPLSESGSAVGVANENSWWRRSDVSQRVLIESFSRDSIQNLAFSWGEFRRATGAYPTECICVGFAFKEKRFRAHVEALGFSGAFEYLGINDPVPQARENSVVGEYLKLRSVMSDPLLRGKRWRLQREGRDPYHQGLPDFATVDPTLADFVHYAWGDGETPAPTPDW